MVLKINLTVYLDNKLKVLGRLKVVSFDCEMNFTLSSKYLLITYFFGLCKLLVCACGVYLVCACMCMHVHMHMDMGGRSQASSSVSFHLMF